MISLMCYRRYNPLGMESGRTMQTRRRSPAEWVNVDRQLSILDTEQARSPTNPNRLPPPCRAAIGREGRVTGSLPPPQAPRPKSRTG